METHKLTPNMKKFFERLAEIKEFIKKERPKIKDSEAGKIVDAIADKLQQAFQPVKDEVK